MTNANIVTIAGRPHDIRCPQSGRTDVSDCCKPMVAFTATMEERDRCAKIVEAWIECYPVRVFTDPPHGQHGATVDACYAKAMRVLLPGLAADIRSAGCSS